MNSAMTFPSVDNTIDFAARFGFGLKVLWSLLRWADGLVLVLVDGQPFDLCFQGRPRNSQSGGSSAWAGDSPTALFKRRFDTFLFFDAVRGQRIISASGG